MMGDDVGIPQTNLWLSHRLCFETLTLYLFRDSDSVSNVTLYSAYGVNQTKSTVGGLASGG